MIFDTILFDLDDTIHDRNKSLCTFVELFELKYSHALNYDNKLNMKDIFEIFNLALSRINSNSKTTLFVGDNPLWDIKGAIDAGLIPVWLSDGQVWDTEHYMPRYIINNVSELMNII